MLNRRFFVIAFIFIFVAIVYIVKLFTIQVLDDRYKIIASDNSIRTVIDYPNRGLIYDRNKELLVFNEASYNLMVIPRQIKDLDTLALCKLLEITKDEFKNRMANLTKTKYDKYKASIFEKEISAKTHAALQEKMYKFKGFYIEQRTIRKYNHVIAAHVLGDIGEVDKNTINKNPYYKSGDYIGLSGIEKSYEEVLRGHRGVKYMMVDVFNNLKGSFKNGEYDSLATQGADIISSIDWKLQAYGEQLMRNKMGSIVAIEPATGEILALVSSPNYDPNLLVGRERIKNYTALLQDVQKPLFNRAVMAKYPPGSTFKLINALIGLQEQTLTSSTTYACSGGFYFGNIKVGCHNHASPLQLLYSIRTSCNAYYCNVFRAIINKYDNTEQGFNKWREYVLSFGLGKKLESDLPNELRGNVPSVDYYNRFYGKNRWNALSVISLAIGQGELGVTPLQMCNMTATIANRGFYYTPHIVKEVVGQGIDKRFKEKHQVPIQKEYFELVIQGMEDVVNQPGGTAGIAKLDSIIICGKTGTAQNPHGKDHSIFTAFAPKNNPKIAISVYVENAGFGATWAAPIASLMIEKYLTDTIKRPDYEKRILEANLIPPQLEKKK